MNTKLNPTSIDEIIFDTEDLSIFQITDIKERVLALRKEFFPRLQFLQKNTLKLIEEIYNVNPYDGMSDFNSPNNRLDAKKNTPPEDVTVGRSGKRRNSKKDEPLKILNAKGKPTYVHSAHLRYSIFNDGIMTVEFLPFSFSIHSETVEKVRLEILENLQIFIDNIAPLQICFCNPEAQRISEHLESLIQTIESENFGIPKKKKTNFSFFIAIEVPTEPLMVQHLQKSYIALYPLFHLCISLGNGKEYDFGDMLYKFRQYYYGDEEDNALRIEVENDRESETSLQLNSLKKEEGIDTEVGLEQDEFSPTPAPTGDEERTKKLVEQNIRQGQQKFRADLLKAYNSRCAISRCDVIAVLEAAHIIPYKGEKTNVLANGLLLRADIHKLFDSYLITVNPKNGHVIIHQSLEDSQYKRLAGRRITIPKNKKLRPSIEAIKAHYKMFLDQNS